MPILPDSRRQRAIPRSTVRPLLTCLLLVLAASTGSAAAQSASAGSTELPPILDLEREIALARSAAPATVSAEATVLVLRRGEGFVVGEEGTSGVTCLVDRTWPQTIEPHCYDPEGAETILPMRLRWAELRERGWPKERIDADIEEGIAAGRFRLPNRPVLTWMMSDGQVLYDDDGSFVGKWQPHLMIYYPGLTEGELGLSGGAYRHGPFLSDAGKPTSTLIIMMPEFVPVESVALPEGEDDR